MPRESAASARDGMIGVSAPDGSFLANGSLPLRVLGDLPPVPTSRAAKAAAQRSRQRKERTGRSMSPGSSESTSDESGKRKRHPTTLDRGKSNKAGEFASPEHAHLVDTCKGRW